MLLFLLFLLPCALITYAFILKDKKLILPVFAGIMTSTIVCACRYFFSYEHRLIYYSFAGNFAYYLVKQNFLPLVLVSVLFALISRDTMEYKFKNFFPLMTSFFAIYLPYCVITSSEIYYQAYDLFLKPIIYLAMLAQISICLLQLWQAITSKKALFIVINILIILIYAIYPAVSDALYAIDSRFALILILGIVYSLVPAALLAIKLIRK